jgi:hypothetical protein
MTDKPILKSKPSMTKVSAEACARQLARALGSLDDDLQVLGRSDAIPENSFVLKWRGKLFLVRITEGRLLGTELQFSQEAGRALYAHRDDGEAV